jgi:hypothetical protein
VVPWLPALPRPFSFSKDPVRSRGRLVTVELDREAEARTQKETERPDHGAQKDQVRELLIDPVTENEDLVVRAVAP